MTTVLPEGVLRLRQGALEWRLVEGEVVVLDIHRAEYLAVNHSGTSLWCLLADGASREQLVQALMERYDLDATQAATDVERFVTALADQHLLDG